MELVVAESPARLRAAEMRLVNAERARRVLDYLVGFHLSPAHLRRHPHRCSDAHVQYAALRLICERENEIESFTPRECWMVDAVCEACDGVAFTARLSLLDGVPVDGQGFESEAMAKRAVQRMRAGVFRVEAVEREEVMRDPAPPFTTSTLLQDASRKLGFGVGKTMRVAQSLYEGVCLDGETAGLITYTRTDAVAPSKSTLGLVRRILRGTLGDRYLSARARRLLRRERDMPDAREAIRPTDFARTPQAMADRLGPNEARLYDLIWRRAAASQMSPARFDRVRASLVSKSGDVGLTAVGSVMTFEGYLRMYRRGREDALDDGAQRRMPELGAGHTVHIGDVRATKRSNSPPRRHTEGSLVRRLGELGVGSPSTHAVVVNALQDSELVALSGGRFVALGRGRDATVFLERFYARWVDHNFTAGLEGDFNRIAGGDAGLRETLRAFTVELGTALERTGAMQRRDILAAIDGPSRVSRSGTGSGLAARPVRSAGGVRSEPRPGPRAGRRLDCAGAPACP